MANRKKILKLLRWFISILISLIILFFVVIWFGAQPWLNKHLSEYIDSKTGGLYQFNFNKIEIRFISNEIKVSEINLSHNQQIAKELQAKNLDKVFYEFSTPEIIINHVGLWKYLLKKEMDINSVRIVNPWFRFTGPEIFGDDSSRISSYAFNELKKNFDKNFLSLAIEDIEFEDASYQFFNLIGDTSKVINAEKVTVGITGFRTDSNLIKNQLQPFTTEDILVRIAGFKNAMSDSIHILKIDSLEYSLKGTGLKAFNSYLYPEYKTGEKSTYDAYIPSFYMKSRNLRNFNFSDTLQISELEFIDPEITFTHKENRNQLDIDDIKNFNLYDLVKNDFSYISIEQINLKNARLFIYKTYQDTSFQQKFNNIGIQLNNFELDQFTRTDPEKLLYADDIRMKILDYTLNLDDNFHRFKADSIYVSTFSDSLVVSGIQIRPLSEKRQNTRTILNIDCKQVMLDSVGLKQVYNNRILAASILNIEKPNVSVEKYPQILVNPGGGKLFELVNAYLEGVYADNINLSEGALSIKNYTGRESADFFESAISINLSDFSLDKESIERTDKLFYASDFEINFTGGQMHFADNLHKLDIQNVHISSIRSSAQIENLHLYPAYPNAGPDLVEEFQRSQLYDILIPGISISGADLHKAFFNKDLRIKNFKIADPELRYENFGFLKGRNDEKEFSELYELIFKYINNISISNLEVPSGEITWTNHSNKGKTISLDNRFSTSLTNFRLNQDEIGKEKLLFSEHVEFSLKDHLFKLSDNVHFFKAGEIGFSTKDKQVIINDALLYPDITVPSYKTIPTTYQIEIPHLIFDKIDLASAYYTKKIDVGKIFFENPKLEIYSQKDRIKTLDLKKFSIPLPYLIESFKVGNLNLSEGEVITYQVDSLQHSQSSSFNLNLNSENIYITHGSEKKPNVVESGNIFTEISDLQIVFNDKSHEVRIDELSFNKQNKNINLTNLRLIPSLYGQPENTFNVIVPSANLTGFDIDKAYENNDYTFEKINFESPKIRISLKDSISSTINQELSNLNLYDYLEPYFNTLEIKDFSLNHAGLIFKTRKTEIDQEEINISLKNIGIGKNFSKKGILNSDGFEFQTFNYSKLLADNTYKFKIDTLNYSSLNNQVELRSISLNPVVSDEEILSRKGFQTDIVNTKIKKITLYNFDFNKWLDKKIIEAGKLEIGLAELDIFRNKRYIFNKNQRPLWPQELLKQIKQPFVIDSVYIKPSTIKYSELLEAVDEPVEVNFYEVTARMDKLSNTANAYSENIWLKVKATGKILNQGKIGLTVDFNMQDPTFLHSVKGSLSPLKMEIFNDIIEKNSMLNVVDGNLNRFDFDFVADNYNAQGELWFGYDNLKVAVLNYKRGDTVKARLNSFMANNFMIDSKNPKGKTFVPDNIIYQRDPSRSILNYWWKSIYSSAKITLGLKEKENK